MQSRNIWKIGAMVGCALSGGAIKLAMICSHASAARTPWNVIFPVIGVASFCGTTTSVVFRTIELYLRVRESSVWPSDGRLCYRGVYDTPAPYNPALIHRECRPAPMGLCYRGTFDWITDRNLLSDSDRMEQPVNTDLCYRGLPY